MPHFVDTNDLLAKSTLLVRRNPVKREIFSPTNIDHIASLKKFLATGNWGDVQFFCEPPYTDVPMSVLMKFASTMLSAHRQTSEERIAQQILAGESLLGNPIDEVAFHPT